MKREGMVHALQEIQRLLGPAGCLLDIHPTTDPALIEVHRHGKILLSVPVPGQTHEDTMHANTAIGQVRHDGLFTLEQAMDFDLRTYAPSVAELRDFIVHESVYDDVPSPEVLALEEPGIVAQVERLLQAYPGEAQVVRLTPARIARLRPATMSRPSAT